MGEVRPINNQDLRDPKILAELEKYISDNRHLTQASIAKDIGRSKTYLSRYLGNDLDNPSAYEDLVVEFLETKRDASQIIRWAAGYVPTSTSSAVYDTIRNRHLFGGMALEVGDAGVGKTSAAKKYLEDNPAQTTLITASPSCGALGNFLHKLCRELGASTGRVDRMRDACLDRLQGQRVLIIDEAQHLTRRAIEEIRSFADEQKNLGIVFIGNSSLLQRMGLDNRQHIPEAYAQISRRLALGVPESRRTEQTRLEDVKLMFPALAADRPALEFLLLIARSKDSIGQSVNVYNNACNVCKASGRSIVTYDSIVSVARSMGLRLGGVA